MASRAATKSGKSAEGGKSAAGEETAAPKSSAVKSPQKAARKRASAKKTAKSAVAGRSPDELRAREDVVRVGLELMRTQLSPGRSGNVSVRFGEGMLISPSGMAYDVITPDDVVFVAGDGTWSAEQRKPSSEWRFHLSALAKRPDRHGVVHTHSLHATVLACRHEPIPAFHYMVAAAGGRDIPCVPYATFGTEELAQIVANGLAARDACLMANHGQIAIGETLDKALALAQEIEVLAEQYCKVLMLGKPKPLGKGEMNEVLKRFASYGQNAQTS